MKIATIVPETYALTGDVYSINYLPLSATKNSMTEGYYASAKWFQPKEASSYTTIARYKKEDWVVAYCFQGTGTTSYFSAPTTSVQLTEGAALIAGAALFVTTVLAL